MHANALPAAAAPARDAEVITLVGVAHGTSHFFHLLLPPLYPWLMKDFGLSFSEVGLLASIFFVISGVGQAVAGFVVDRVGARPVLFGGITLLGVAGLLLSAAGSYSGLMAVAAVAGLGNCIFHPADFTLLNRRVTAPRLGHAFSVHGLSGNLGWAAAPIMMGGITAMTGDWHLAGFGAAALAFGVLALLVWRRDVLDEHAARAVAVPGVSAAAAPPAPAAADGAVVPTFGFLSSGAVWLCFLFFFFATAAFGILQNYAPALLREVYGLPLATATACLTAFLVGSAGGMLAGGFVAARTARNEWVIAAALGAAALLALLLSSAWVPGWAVLPLMALMGFGTGTAGPSRDLLVRRAATARFGKASFGRVYGFVYSGLDLGLALSPVVFGPMLDAGRFSVALSGVAVLQTAALLSALRVGRSATARA